jgi:hypothetical protein
MRAQERIWSSVFLICLSIPWCGDRSATHRIANEAKSTPPTNVAISLDLIPMTDPVAAFITVTPDNKATLVHYSRNLLAVRDVLEGNLSASQATLLSERKQNPEFTKALRTKSFGAGLTRGDQFHLWIAENANVEECFGFVDDAPAIVRSLIADLLSMGKQLKPAVPADAYLRSEPISPTRYEALRRSAKLPFTSTGEFPINLQSMILRATNSPRQFFPLTTNQYQALLTYIAPGHEFLLSDKGSGHQLTLFRIRNFTKGEPHESLNTPRKTSNSFHPTHYLPRPTDRG